jgi:threonine/homoserine/homoserine lactone efflux protein
MGPDPEPVLTGQHRLCHILEARDACHMQPEHVIAFNITLLAAMASPGPALVVAIRTVLSAGGRAGMAIGCGLGIAAAGWTLAALVGLDAVFRLIPWSYMLVKIVGGLYLSYLAYGIWKAAPQPVAEAVIPVGHAFRSGLLVNLSNPKSVLFAAAVLVAIFPLDMDIAHKLAIVGNHLGIELAFYAMLAATMSRKSVRTRYFAMKLYLDRFAAAVLQVLATNILFTLW